MSDENIEIKITDKVDSSISLKIKAIAADSRTADSALVNLQKQLNSLNGAGLNTILQNATKASTALAQTTIAAQKLATEQQRTGAAAAIAAAAQTRANTASIAGATAQERLTAATARAQSAQTQSATAAQRLATEQQRTSTATSAAAAANDRAALSALRLQQAQDKQTASMQRATTSLSTYLKAAAGIAGVSLSANAILSSADAYVTLQNKLQNVAESQEQVNVLTKELFSLANETRSSVIDTATAFTRFDRALLSMGKSQEDTLRLTGTINKALIVGGATAQEASSALLQLSQAFNAGKLQGDEFRAVSENMPIVLDAVAQATNQPINKIKEMASEGKITSEVLFKAFSLIEDKVNSTFGKTLPTMGQAFTVLKNNAMQFFGELNTATGFTATLAAIMLSLAANMKTVAVIATGIGVAMLFAFGPSILAAIVGVTTAIKAFTIALAMNPVGLILVALSTAIAYFTLFRDEIKLGIDDVTTLGDFFSVVFSGMISVIDNVKTSISELWATLFDSAEVSLSDTSAAVTNATGSWYDDYAAFFETNRTGWAAALEWAAKTFDAIAGLLTGLGTFAGRALAQVVISVQGAIASAYDFIASYVERVTNMAIEAANKLRSLVGKAAYELVDFEKMGSSGASEFEGFGKLWAESLEDGFKSQGGSLQALLNDTFSKAASIGESRKTANPVSLRGSSSSKLSTDTDATSAKSAERRGLALEKINTQLDNEIARMYQLQPQREAQAKFDQIEEALIQKKITLTDSEVASIKQKITAVQDASEVQKQFDSIYSESIGPLKEYTATQEAANKLLSIGAISQEQYSSSMLKSSEAYANSQDPMRQYNKDLQQQFDLLSLLPKQREIEQQVMQVQNDLLTKGIQLNSEELSQLRERLILLQQVNAVAQQEASLLESSVTSRQNYIDQLTAINRLKNDQSSGFTQGDAAGATDGLLQGMGIDTTNFQSSIDSQLASYQTYTEQLKMLNDQKLISDQEYASASMQVELGRQNVYLNSASSFFGNLASLQSSSNKKMAAVGKAAAIAQAMISTYQGATSAYASLAPIPVVGPALGIAAAAAAVVAGLANVQQIRSQSTGFKTGGYTGSMGVDEVAGVVHGQEYVMTAAATNRIGVNDLQALQTGAASVQRNSDQAGQANSGTTAAAAAPIVNVPFSAVVVQSKEAALGALKSSEGRAFILETIEENGSTVAKIVGVK